MNRPGRYWGFKGRTLTRGARMLMLELLSTATSSIALGVATDRVLRDGGGAASDVANSMCWRAAGFLGDGRALGATR